MEPSLPSELGRGRMAPLGRNVGVLQRGMPAGVIGPARQVAPVGVLDVRRKSAIMPLSAEAVELSPTMGPKIDVITGQETVSSGAGGVAPVVVADVPVLTGAGVRFSAVAEVHASAVELDDDILVVQASEQRAVCSTDPGRAPMVGCAPTAGAFGSEPLKHLVQRVDLDGRPTEGVVVLEPLEHSVLDVSLDSGPMAGKLDLEPLEHSVSEEDQTSGSMEGEFGPELLEHPVLDMYLDSQPRNDMWDSGPLEHSVPGRAPSGGAVYTKT